MPAISEYHHITKKSIRIVNVAQKEDYGVVSGVTQFQCRD